jgi:hypothetical protein
MSFLGLWLSGGLLITLITDGAWGTELQACGIGSASIPDIWNLTYPDRVEPVARAYAGGRQLGHPHQHLPRQLHCHAWLLRG